MEILEIKYRNQNKKLSGLKLHFQDVNSMKISAHNHSLPSEKRKEKKICNKQKTNHLKISKNVPKA